MKYIAIAVMMAALSPVSALAQGAAGDAVAGAAAYRANLCFFCHGDNAEGAYGPDLAGRGLSLDQFRKAVRVPWGVMLSFDEKQISDAQLAAIYAFVKSKPPAKEPGPWVWPAIPASAPYGQRVYNQITGCGQCHGPENRAERGLLGRQASDVNFEYFKKTIYTHTTLFPKGLMGNYSPDRLSERDLREIYKFMVEDLGLRVQMRSALAVTGQQGDATNFTVTVTNNGIKDKGLTAEGITVFVRVPNGAKVISGSGTGYKGVQPFAALGLEPALAASTRPNEQGQIVRPKADLSGDVLVWKIAKVAAGDRQELTFTLAGTPTADLLKGFEGSTVHWDKPGRTAFGQKLAYRDTRSPDKGDHERIAPPAMPKPPAKPAGD